jgi:pimeloyl-ACP methyl ester carboxylesterase
MQKEIIYQHKKIHYQILGNGYPVLLIHGFGEDSSIWRNQIDFFKENYKLIIPDLPGSGQSEIIDDMSIEGMAEALNAILKAEAPPTSPKGSLSNKQYKGENNQGKIKASKISASYQSPPMGGWGASILGHSMGGYIGLAFAEKYPEKIKKFGLIHSTAFADSEEKINTRKKGIDFVRKHGAREFLETTIPNLFSKATQEKKPELITGQIGLSNYFQDEAIIKYYHAMIDRPDRTGILKKAVYPVLFIAGQNDIAVPLADILKQCHLPDISYFHILPETAHMGMLEEPESFNHILKKFLISNMD